MNLIITTGCNKGCPYCFASEVRHRDDDNTMSFKTFSDILDKIQKSGENRVKLIGGEPTQHPQFEEFVDEIIKRKMHLVLISNFLFSKKITSKIIEATKSIPIDFLINSTNLDEGNLIKTWSRNYNEIYSHLYKYDLEEKISCGITFERDKSWEYYVQYVDFLLQHIPKIERLRLSLDFPGDNSDKNNFYFINETSYGDKFISLINKCHQIGATPSIDCVVYPCMFENKEHFKYVKKFGENFKTECYSAPSDMFPNQEAIYCYPLENAIRIDTKNLEYGEVQDKLLEEYDKIRNKVEVPEECLVCPHFKKTCNGPCLGFFNLEGV